MRDDLDRGDGGNDATAEKTASFRVHFLSGSPVD